jgi:outer membrane protein assembly factor BamB
LMENSELDRYLKGELSAEELQAFLNQLETGPVTQAACEALLDTASEFLSDTTSAEPISHDVLIAYTENKLDAVDREIVEAYAELDLVVRAQIAELAANRQALAAAKPVLSRRRAGSRPLIWFSFATAAVACLVGIALLGIRLRSVTVLAMAVRTPAKMLDRAYGPRRYAELAVQYLSNAAPGRGSGLLSPLCTAVESDRPELSWQPVRGATQYRVSVTAQGSKTPVHVTTTALTHLTCSPLPAGVEFSWSVTALFPGHGWVAIVNGATGLPGVFRVLSKDEARRYRAGRAAVGAMDRIGRAILDIRFGLLLSAEAELILARGDPGETAERQDIDRALSQVRSRWTNQYVTKTPRDSIGRPDLTATFGKATVGPDGTVYLPSALGLKALSPIDGSVIWSCVAPPGTAKPAIGLNGTLYYDETRPLPNTLFAIDPETGSIRWKTPITDDTLPTNYANWPICGPDGTIYLAVGEHGLVALDPDHGSIKWTYPSNPSFGVAPAIGRDGTIFFSGVVYEPRDAFHTGAPITKITPVLYAVTPAGKLLWKHVVKGVFASPAVGVNGSVFVATNAADGAPNVYAFDPATGAARWSIALGDGAMAIPAVGVDGTVYISGNSGRVFALKPSDGTIRWSFPLEGDGTATPAILGADGTVYAGLGPTLYALTPSGRMKWKFKLNGNIVSKLGGPTIAADGTVYVGDDQGFFYAIRNAATGPQQ